MKQIYVVLASVIFVVELISIEFSAPKNTQILLSGILFALFFYLTLRPQKTSSGTQKNAKKKTKPKAESTEPEQPKSKSKSKKGEEEESDFDREWKRMEREAKA